MSEYETQLYRVESKFKSTELPLIFDMVFINWNYKVMEGEGVTLHHAPSIYGFKPMVRQPQNLGKEMNVLSVVANISRIMFGDQAIEDAQRSFSHENVAEQLSKEQLSWYDSFAGTTTIDGRSNPLTHRNLITTLKANDGMDIIFKMMSSQISVYMLDLFYGTSDQNADILNLLRISRRICIQSTGRAFGYSVLGLLSPRIAITGRLRKNREQVELKKGAKIIVTGNRKYATLGSKNVIYVNCILAMSELKVDDYIHIDNITLRVIRTVNMSAECLIVREGILRPGIRVIFPCNTMLSRASVEEIEDISFIQKCEIDVIILPMAGCGVYYKNIHESMMLLNCNARLFARVTQLELCSEEYGKWVASTYDGVVLVVAEDLKPRQVVRFTKQTRSFIKRCYDLKKTVICSSFLPTRCIVKDIITVAPIDQKYFFYYPDTYLLQSHEFTDTHMAIYDEIWCDINARIEGYAKEDFAAPFEDKSFTGSDTIARQLVRAAYDMDAGAIIVCTVSGRMAEKIAHFRPRCPIIAVTKNTSGFKYLEVFHNVCLALYTESTNAHTHKDNFKKLLYGLLYGLTFRLIEVNANVIVVCRSIRNIGYPNIFFSFQVNSNVIELVFDKLK